MGTKTNPGKYDCLEKADPDEPFFTLLARDPAAAHLVSIWSKLRMQDYEAAERVFRDLIYKTLMKDSGMRDGDMEKAEEALHCSSLMFEWIRNNRPERVL